MPFVYAGSDVANLADSKAEFLDLKEQIAECNEAGDNCDKLEKKIIPVAKDYIKYTANVMVEYIKEIKDDTEGENNTNLVVAQGELYDAINSIDDLETKEDIKAMAADIAVAWDGVVDIIMYSALESFVGKAVEVVEQAEEIGEKLACTVDKLKEQGEETTDIEYELGLYDARVVEAKEKHSNAQSVITEDYEQVKIEVRLARISLENADQILESLMEKVDAFDFDMSECDVEEEETEDDTEDDVEDVEDESDEDDTEDDVENETASTFEQALEDSGLEDDYDNAVSEMNRTQDEIADKEADGYGISSAENKLAEAENYLLLAENYILNNESGLAYSNLLNAKDAAIEARDDNMFSTGTGTTSSDDGDAVGTKAEFIVCMDEADYSSDRIQCYSDFDISDDDKDDIEDCIREKPSDEEDECWEDIEPGEGTDDDDNDSDEYKLEIELEDFTENLDEDSVSLTVEGTDYTPDISENDGELTIELTAELEDNDDVTLEFDDDEGNEFKFRFRLYIDDDEYGRVQFDIEVNDFDEDFEEDSVTFEWEGSSFDYNSTELYVDGIDIEFDDTDDEDYDFGTSLNFEFDGEDDDNDDYSYQGDMTVDVSS